MQEVVHRSSHYLGEVSGEVGVTSMKDLTAIEKSAVVLSLVRTPFGRIGLWALFSLGIYWSGIFEAWWLVPILLLINSSAFRMKWLSTLHIVAWIASSSIFMITDKKTYYVDFFVDYPQRVLLGVPTSPEVIKYLSLAIVLAAFVGLYHLYTRVLRNRNTIRNSLLVLLLVYLCIAFSSVWWSSTDVGLFLLSGVLIISSKFILYFVSHIYGVGDATVARGKFHLGILFPLWAQHGLPFVSNGRCQTEEEFLQCQLRGVKLLFWCLILQVFSIVFRRAINALDVPILVEVGFKGLPQDRTVAESWLIIVYAFLAGLLHLTIYQGAYIAVARMCGFPLFRNIYRPFESKNMSEFFLRTNYYFCQMLVYLFFYPIWGASRILRLSPTPRVFIATCSALFIGGTVLRMILNIHLVVAHGAYGPWQQVLWYMPYHAVIGLISASSVAFRNKIPVGDALFARIFRPIVFVVVFSLAVIFLVDPKNLDWTDRITFFFSLMGLG